MSSIYDEWSPRRRWVILGVIAAAAVLAPFSDTIYLVSCLLFELAAAVAQCFLRSGCPALRAHPGACACCCASQPQAWLLRHEHAHPHTAWLIASQFINFN